MFAKLNGIVDSVKDNELIIDVNGVGYVLSCSILTSSKLELGKPAKVFVHTQVKEDAIDLFAFFQEEEKEWFLLLNQVNGVSGKTAINILSQISLSEIAYSIQNEDKKILQKISGIGEKLAARIILELKNNKKVKLLLGSMGAERVDGGKLASNLNLQEVEVALVSLGYKKYDINQVLNNLSKEVADFNKIPTSQLIRLALQRLR
ncbi:MAG: Holliday junction branch migration protein RuvA [Alphaproteobacteria bacterium]|jgi:Holliday junction DNA helicase RuvA